MRLIDADALREQLFSYYGCVNEDTSKSNYKGETLMAYEVADMIDDCLDDAPTIEAEPVKWIPVTEMEPERTGWFLTFGPQRKTAVVHFDSDGVWSDEDDYNIDVTHWMPLPKPPEDGGAENA